MKKIIFIFVLTQIFKSWEFIEQNGIRIYQIDYKDFNKFISTITDKAVMEIKKGTPQDFIDHIIEYFADFFVFFQRTNEGTLHNGGVTIFPPGQFDYKIKHIKHFKPYNTNINDIKKELMKSTEELSQQIQLVQLNEAVRDNIKQNKIPVLFIEENDNQQNHLGYRFLPYALKLRKYFQFYHISEHQIDIKNQYKLSKLPAMLVFNEIEIEGVKKIKVAPYIDEMSFAKLEKFLFQILDLHFDGKDPMRHDSMVFEYTTNLDPKLNYCFNKNCLLIFNDPSKEDKLLDKTKTIAKNIKRHFDEHDLAVYLLNGICYQDLMKDLRLDPDDLPQTILYDKSKQRYFFYPFGFEMNLIVDFIKRAENETIQSQELPENYKLEIEDKKCDQILNPTNEL